MVAPKSRADQLQGFRAIPFTRAIYLIHYSPIRVDEHSQWDSRCAQHIFHLQPGVNELVDSRIGSREPFFGPGQIVVRRDANDAEMAGWLEPREPVQRGHFTSAWAAPTCPEIDDQRPAAEFGQLSGRTIDPLQRRFPNSIPDIDLPGRFCN